MNCPQCAKPMIVSYTFMGAPFDYCKYCKKELAEMSNKKVDHKTSLPVTHAFYDACKISNSYVSVGNYLCIPLLFSTPIGMGFPLSPSIIKWTLPVELATPSFPPRDWIPYTEPQAGDNFYGIDRTMDTWRLAGGRYDGTKETKEEAIVNSLGHLAREGAQPTRAFLHKNDYDALVACVTKKYLKFRAADNDDESFLIIHGPYGRVEVWPDLDVSEGYGYILQMDTWRRDPVFGTYCTNPGYNLVVRFK